MRRFFQGIGRMFSRLGSAVSSGVSSIGKDIPSEFVAEYLVEAATGAHKTGPGREAPREHTRGRLMADITLIEQELGGTFTELRRRLREALKEDDKPFNEDQVIKLLSHIPKDARKVVFGAYDEMTDEEFWLEMEHLHHNRIPQAAKLLWKRLSPQAKAWIVSQAKKHGGQVDAWLANRADAIRAGTMRPRRSVGRSLLIIFVGGLGLVAILVVIFMIIIGGF